MSTRPKRKITIRRQRARNLPALRRLDERRAEISQDRTDQERRQYAFSQRNVKITMIAAPTPHR